METSEESDLSAQGMGTNEPVSNVGILGCRVSKVTLSAAVGLIEEWIQRPAQKPRYVVATGFHGLWEAQKDPEFQKVLNSSDLFCPDGIAPVWLSRLNGEALPGRVPGPDLLPLSWLKLTKPSTAVSSSEIRRRPSLRFRRKSGTLIRATESRAPCLRHFEQ